MQEEIFLTIEGINKIKDELEELKGPVRAKIASRLRSAIEMGDLSENADYIKAKEDQGFLEGRIQELEETLKHVMVIDQAEISSEQIQIGSRIVVKEEIALAIF